MIGHHNIEPPIFCFSSGETLIFKTAKAAVGYLEPPDLESTNAEIYDASGARLEWESAPPFSCQMIEFTEIDRSPMEKARFRLRLIESLLPHPNPDSLFHDSIGNLIQLNIQTHGII